MASLSTLSGSWDDTIHDEIEPGDRACCKAAFWAKRRSTTQVSMANHTKAAKTIQRRLSTSQNRGPTQGGNSASRAGPDWLGWTRWLASLASRFPTLDCRGD